MFGLSLWNRIQERTWPWMALTCVLVVEQALDFVTTVVDNPHGIHEMNPATRFLLASGGAPAFLVAKLAIVLILIAFTIFYIRAPRARVGAYALLALMSSFWTALFYAWILLGNILQLTASNHP